MSETPPPESRIAEAAVAAPSVSPRSPGRNGRPSLDSLLKLTALGSAVLYGVLFLGYRSYYSRLGLSPEELGVSNTFILVRSIGFILLMVVIAGSLGIIWIQARQFEPGRITRGDVARWLTWSLLGALLSGYTAFLAPGSWWAWSGVALGLVVSAIGGVSGLMYKKHPRASVVVLLMLGSLLTLVLPTAAVAGRARELADDVTAGTEVAPFSLLNVPVLDISAVRVEVTWIDSPEQRPAMFGTTAAQSVEGLLLGQSSGTVILAIPVGGGPSRIVRLPASSVAIVTV